MADLKHINRMPTAEDYNRLIDALREQKVTQVPRGLDLKENPGGTAILGKNDVVVT